MTTSCISEEVRIVLSSIGGSSIANIFSYYVKDLVLLLSRKIC